MILGDVQRIMESWAPREIAWERDTVGIQIGSKNQPVRKILVSLDASEEVIQEAVQKKIDLLITHHPLFFHHLRRISTDDRTGSMVTSLVRNRIGVYSAHTNLDFAAGGVSHALALQLKLTNITVLKKNLAVLKKIVVFVPLDYSEKVFGAMTDAGAGAIGKYEACSFGTKGTGTFRARKGAKPFIGSVGSLERTPEVRIEVVAPSWLVEDVLRAMRSVHPYEEVAYDVYNLANTHDQFGAGAIGEYKRPMTTQNFLASVKRWLGAETVRFSRTRKKTIRRVAVCGGSGSDLLSAAMDADADVFVTADVGYHRFQEAENRILLVDAGHYETEFPILHHIVQRLSAGCQRQNERIEISVSSKTRNPVFSY